MLKYCLRKWEENKKALEENLRSDPTLNSCCYSDLLEKVTDIILNGGEKEKYEKWDSEHITMIDNGEYGGTLLFLIPRGFVPAEYDYLMTYVGYGSCSVCDTLQSIQNWKGGKLNDKQVEDFMTLCRHLVCSMVKPYNNGWRNEEEFEEVQVEIYS